MFRESEDYEHCVDFIRTKSRYVLDGGQQDFVDTIIQTSKKRTTTLTTKQVLWRAAEGYENPAGVHPHEVFFLNDIKPRKIEGMMRPQMLGLTYDSFIQVVQQSRRSTLRA